MSIIVIEGGPLLTNVAAVSASITDRTSFEASTSWTELLEGLIQDLRREYAFQSEAVAGFLRRNADVAWVLFEAKSALQAAFGVSVKVRLAVVSDPDIDTVSQKLFAYIRTTLPLTAALAALDSFDREW